MSTPPIRDAGVANKERLAAFLCVLIVFVGVILGLIYLFAGGFLSLH